MYTLKLSDGSEIGGLRMVNNTLRSVNEITREMLAGKMSPCVITGESGEGEDSDWGNMAREYAHGELVYIRRIGDEYALALREIPEDEYERAKTAGDIAYLSIMTGVEL